MPLSDRDRAILDFEEQWRRPSGAKDQAMRDQFNLSPARYYQRLNLIIQDPAALAAKPMLVKALQRGVREREARHRARELR